MSRAGGYIWSTDGTLIGGAMYCGTTDVMWSRVFPSTEAAWDVYRSMGRDEAWEACDADCACGQEPTPCFLGSDYGGLNHWPGSYCPRCLAITGGTTLFDVFDADERYPIDGPPPTSPTPTETTP